MFSASDIPSTSPTSELKQLSHHKTDQNSRLHLPKDITRKHAQKPKLSLLVKISHTHTHGKKITQSKEINKALMTDLREMEIYKLSDKEFKIILKKFEL